MSTMERVFVVKHTFLEVALPQQRARLRSMSDTGILLPEGPATSDECCEIMSTVSTSSPADSAESDCASEDYSKVASWADESDASDIGDDDDEQKTTVMFRNVPYNCTRDDLIGIMDSHGFRGLYDFVYAPADFRTKSGFGYAFINLSSHSVAQGFMEHFNGFSEWPTPASKVAEVGWSEPNQGLALHVERYRNSPVMHDGVPDEFKPALFKDGQRITFPAPTKAIRAPRFKRR
jgi:hypothetical protein